MAKSTTWGEALYTIRYDCAGPHDVPVSGRDRWALEALISAGAEGCTPITTPGPRWSAYVHNLRGLGVPIETMTEAHDGPFKGTHAKYILRAIVALKTGASA